MLSRYLGQATRNMVGVCIDEQYASIQGAHTVQVLTDWSQDTMNTTLSAILASS